MEKKLNENQILNFYKNIKKLDEPTVGKIMVLTHRDSDGQFTWTKCYKIAEVEKRSLKVVDKHGYEHWYLKDKYGYGKANMQDGKLHFNCRILSYRDHIHPTYYDMEDGIDYTVIDNGNEGTFVKLEA